MKGTELSRNGKHTCKTGDGSFSSIITVPKEGWGDHIDR